MMGSFKQRNIESGHHDLINDVAFDFYGRRLATCSSDHTVKVWDQGEDGQWHCSCKWKAHSGAVWKVTWAHPEFGQVLATCSFDRTAAVWEEIVSDASSDHHQNTWIRRAPLVDSRTSVADVRFSPRYMGLQLATVSADGVIRIYEAMDVMNLSTWSLEHELSMRCAGSCISWSPAPSGLSQLLAAGSEEQVGAANPHTGGAKVLVFEYSKGARKWSKVQNLTAITDKVHDIAFAPNMGRSFHVLGIASTAVRIVALAPPAADNGGGGGAYEVRELARLEDHRSVVWRVAWSITGTILGSSGDDGCVRLWKANYLNHWKCICKLLADNSAAADREADGAAAPNASGNALSTAKYYKLGAIKRPNEVAWH
ncbi:nucleoporin SEH1-like [Pollicipes pollicipes]|uniref:nucleoporin SEH1-like n=1 Tax=Pollicipes pollicipes TaxID=41117 RepID=UPI0018849977|nr:nucleoporin SEH1-like [Pollicipes pollicipes]XP_037091548.1 nucleoporin SEH1-like [Pollicipes pollicipes]